MSMYKYHYAHCDIRTETPRKAHEHSAEPVINICVHCGEEIAHGRTCRHNGKYCREPHMTTADRYELKRKQI